MDIYNHADTFNKMFRDSENNGYKTSYTKVKNECGIDLLDLYMKRARYYAKKYPSWECYEIK